jgi:hypothetical protein
MIYAEITPISKTQNLLSQYNYTIFLFQRNLGKRIQMNFQMHPSGPESILSLYLGCFLVNCNDWQIPLSKEKKRKKY